jgi:glycosyltransferase involved in cell wall biosynthesis
MVANAGFTLTNFRKEIILSLKDLGNEVTLLCPYDERLDSFFKKELETLNVKHLEIPLERKGLNPLKDIRLSLVLYNIFKKESPDYVFNYTIKPVIYSSIAARLAGVKSINSFITGLGFVFTNEGWKAKFIKVIVCFLYKISLKGNKNIFFQNPDDLALFLENRLIKEEQSFVINGSGVNLKKFYPQNVKKIPHSFIFIGRLLKDKGIFEFIDAIKMAKKKNLKCNFFVCGSIDESNPAALNKYDLDSLIGEQLFTYIDYTNDIPNLLKDKEVFILPSYREGTPRSTLEAMAMGLPIITTDTPGCRETVKDQRNGFLVPVGNAAKIYDKICYFINNPSDIQRMGLESLKIAKERYDVEKVNLLILNKIGLIDN